MSERCHGPIMLPDPLVEEVKSEVDIFFLDDGSDQVTDANAVTRGWRPPDATTKEIWDKVCEYLDSGLDTARAKITPTVIIDWPFYDTGPGGLNLTKDEALFERGWVFQVEGFDARLMIHGHTFLKWSERAGKPIGNRADDLTSVNYRIAVLDNASGSWKQNDGGTLCLPVNCVQWHKQYYGNRANVIWKWREWRGDEAGIPRADLAQGARLDAGNKRKYKRVQTLLQLAAEGDYKETDSKDETNKTIRSHGQLEVVGEMDITPIRKKVCPSERARFEIGLRDAGWSGLRLAALCIGVGAYSGPSRLDNPVRDAEALFEAINKCPDCRAAIVRDPPDKSTILDHLQNKFLNELAALSADKLPEVVALVLASHGMQHESNVFLIPAKAQCNSKMDLEDNCLSHTRVLEYLHECLDARARRASGSAQKEVKFVLIMDMCRVPGEFDLTKTISEPDQNKAPGCWSICYSTSRGTVAADGAPGSHSPLVLGLLDPQSGIFAPGVSMKQGIEHACKFVEKRSSVNMRQSPTDMKLYHLGDFKLKPAAAESRPYESSYNCSNVSKRKREVTADLLALLGEFRVQDEAERLAKNGVCSIEDVPCMTMEDVEKFKLRLIFREKLRNLQQRALEICLQKVAHPMCSREPSPTPSDRSGMHTPPQSPFPRSLEIIAMHVERSVSKCREDMKTFIEDLLHKPSDHPAPRKWKLCELLLVGFMRNNGCYAPEFAEDLELLKAWQCSYERMRSRDTDVNLIDEFNDIMLELKPPTLKEKLNYEFADGNKQYHISVFVINWMVKQHSLNGNFAEKQWETKVEQQWFDRGNADSADDFLDRAESFLQESADGINILGNVIQTNSYVVFLRMEPLAALLLREYYKQQQNLHAQQQMQLDSEDAAPKSSSTWPLAITLMVSSSNWCLSFTDAEGPSDDHVSEIVGRLRRIACLPAEVLEDNECSLDKSAFVDWEPLYNLKGNGRSEATSLPSGDSGAASSGPSPPADAIKDYDKEIKGYVKDFKRRFDSYEDAASGEKLSVEEMSISVQASLSEPGKDSPEVLTEAHVLNADDAPHDADRMRQLMEQRETSRRNGAEGEEERSMFLRRLGYDVSKDTDTSPQAEKTNLKVIESAEMLLHRLRKGHFMCLIGPPASGKTVTMLQVACAAADAMQRHVDMGLLQDTLPPRIPIFMRAAELSTLIAQTENDTETPDSLEALVKLYVDARYPNPKHPRISEMLIYFLKLRRVLILIDGLDEAADNRHVIEKMIDHTAGANDMCLMISTRDYAFETSRMHARFGGFETLGAFEAFTILPLDEQRRGQFIERRLKEDRQNFQSQLVTVMKDTPEMAASPFLLALMIEVFKKHGDLPAKRTELYDRQVDGILLRHTSFRHFAARCVDGPSASLQCIAAQMIFRNKNLYQKRMPFKISGSFEASFWNTEEAKRIYNITAEVADTYRFRYDIFQNLDFIQILKDSLSEMPGRQQEAGTECFESPICHRDTLREFLEVLAFVCQMRMETRDFQWDSSQLQAEVHGLWQDADQLELVKSECKFVLDLSSVGLLSRVGEGEYRFSHLTLQEYLAASFVFNHFGHDAQELLNQFKPLYSPWKRMVLQFTACMLSEQVFDSFCQLVLASDDGTGSHCELVQDFLKERGASEKVEQMVRDKLQKIRRKVLIAGLCHPSSELRHIVLSEMKKFGVPPDPFAETDGTAAALRRIGEDGASKWHNRAAAVLSLVQMAQMDHCRKGNGRSDTLQWLLAMLTPDQSEDIRFALVAGLGTLLKGFEKTETKDGIMLVAAEDEPLLLGALKQSANGVVMEAVADLKAYSDRLMDWALKESSLIAEGVWPMRHLLHVFCFKIANLGNHDRAEKLGQQLFGRVHAMSEEVFEKEQGDVLKGLDMICPVMRDDRWPLFLHLLQSGEVEQRSRVMQVAAELGMQFVSKSRKSLETLAQALLSDVDEGCTLADLMEGGSLLAALLSDESDRKHESLREPATVFVYLMESLGPSADQGLEAPKRVVDFLVEFEKNHLASAAAAAAAKAAAAGNRNETKAIEKSQETNPEEMGKEDKKHSEDLYLERLAAAVEDFTPRDLSTRSRQPEKPLTLYCAARLWATSGLLQERTSEEIAVWLSLSEAMAKEGEDAFSNLQGLKEPWVSGHGCKDGRWLQHVLEGMRNEAQCLGRFMFTSFLEYIRERQMKDMSRSGIDEIEEQVKDWKPFGAKAQLEQQLLLKQVRIGRRSQELPSWAGVTHNCLERFLKICFTITS